MTTSSKERLARNEALFREINERIRDAAAAHGSDGHLYQFLCECADTECLERVELTLSEYERVRADGRRFVVSSGHRDPDLETVVAAEPGHEVVEKRGEAGHAAARLDPRAA
jgi:hypothetical protein